MPLKESITMDHLIWQSPEEVFPSFSNGTILLSCCTQWNLFPFSVFLSSPLNAAISQLVNPPQNVVIYVSLAFYMNESVGLLILIKDRSSPISPYLRQC